MVDFKLHDLNKDYPNDLYTLYSQFAHYKKGVVKIHVSVSKEMEV